MHGNNTRSMSKEAVCGARMEGCGQDVWGGSKARRGVAEARGARMQRSGHAGQRGGVAVVAPAGAPRVRAALASPMCCCARLPCSPVLACSPPPCHPAPPHPMPVSHVEQYARPVGAVRHQAQVGQGALGGAHLALYLAQLIREGDEELAVPLEGGGGGGGGRTLVV